MKKNIVWTIIGIMAFIAGMEQGAEAGEAGAPAYGIWEVDAEDVGSDLTRLFFEFSSKKLIVHPIASERVEPHSREIWWISRDGNLYFSPDGRNDTLVLFLDDKTMRLENRGEKNREEKLLLRRSSQAEMKAASSAFQEAARTKRKTNERQANAAAQIEIKGLAYTIHTPGQGSATLAMSVVLELGVTPTERERKTAPTDAEMDRIRGIVDSLINRVKEHLNTFIPSLGVGVLQGPNGPRYIKDEIRRFINDGLKEMHIKDLPAKVNRERITQVLLTEYQWQQDG